MTPSNSPRPVFGRPGWRRRMEAQYGWDKEFKAAGIILLLILASLAFARADDSTGLPGDDPKDVGPERPEVSTTSCVSEMFLPIPEWSRFTKMPPLPERADADGRVAGERSQAARRPPWPRRSPMARLRPSPRRSRWRPAPDPDQVAISPFLQWIKDHPQDAVAAGAQGSRDGCAARPRLPRPARSAAGGAPADPYWMPPMIDSAAAPTVEASSRRRLGGDLLPPAAVRTFCKTMSRRLLPFIWGLACLPAVAAVAEAGGAVGDARRCAGGGSSRG